MATAMAPIISVGVPPTNRILLLSVPSSPFSSKPKLLLKPNSLRLKLNSVHSNTNTHTSNGESPTPNSETHNPSLLFPGGFKRPELKLPTIVLQLCADEVVSNSSSVLDVVDSAVSKWVGIILLEQGSAASNLYKAACLLKPLIRNRAFLLISDRVDIASAVGAAGVVLSDQGLPIIVARNAMMDSKSDSVFLPLVGKSVQSLDAALVASNSEGADFLIYTPLIEDDHVTYSVLQSMYTDVKIPIFAPAVSKLPVTLLRSGASGLVIKLQEFKNFSAETLTQLLSVMPKSGETVQLSAEPNTLDGVPGFVNLDETHSNFLNKEKRVLLEAVDIFQRAAPLTEEVSLLSDAIAHLDDPFMLVVVGEFNSGKSTVINALLGGRFLKEGVIPTTNEITFLRYSEVDSGETQRCERHPDGQYICYLPAKILNKMVIVDTPGTNVILQRQQRLTEEFVPRADLLIFVISADRPLTESEVTFLRYTQQWKKRFVFVLNKADMYQNSYQLEEATMFVKENIQRLLNTEQVMLYPVSARAALEAKLSSPNFGSRLEGVVTDSNVTSGFYEFEKFLYNLMDGSADAGKERVQMKFETPIGIAERLLSACQTLVNQESRRAKQDLNSVEALISSVAEYKDKLESGSISWRRQILSLVDSTQGRILKLVGLTLQLSNLDVAISFLLKGEKSYSMPATRSIQNDIIGPAVSDAQRVLGEYTAWLQENNAREGKQFKETFEKRWSSFIDPNNVQVNLDSNRLLIEVDNLSIQALKKFKADEASKLFDQEIREVFLGAFGGLGAAGLSASLLTSVLPTTLEDLLALSLCSAGGLLAVSNFPGRRQKTIDKVKSISDIVRSEVEEAMIKDLAVTVRKLEWFVQAIGEPYKEAAQRRLDKLVGIQAELTGVEKQLQSLQIELQNIHLS